MNDIQKPFGRKTAGRVIVLGIEELEKGKFIRFRPGEKGRDIIKQSGEIICGDIDSGGVSIIATGQTMQ